MSDLNPKTAIVYSYLRYGMTRSLREAIKDQKIPADFFKRVDHQYKNLETIAPAELIISVYSYKQIERAKLLDDKCYQPYFKYQDKEV